MYVSFGMVVRVRSHGDGVMVGCELVARLVAFSRR
jgi:hypothetical protein